MVPNGTTILDWADDLKSPLLYDHYDGIDQWQVSFNLPLDIVDADFDSSEYISVQLGNGPRTSLIYQDVNIPVDANVTGITLQWRMAYWNTLGVVQWKVHAGELAVPGQQHRLFARQAVFQVIETCSGLRAVETLTMTACIYWELFRRDHEDAQVG